MIEVFPEWPMPRRQLNPRKLLLSKWTAVRPQNSEKHFIVSKVHEPLEDSGKPLQIELEAVLSRRAQVLPWQVLLDQTQWLQGWR